MEATVAKVLWFLLNGQAANNILVPFRGFYVGSMCRHVMFGIVLCGLLSIVVCMLRKLLLTDGANLYKLELFVHDCMGVGNRHLSSPVHQLQ